MATLEDLGVSALINIVGVVAFLLLFSILRGHRINDRVYFPKWYIEGSRTTRPDLRGVGKLGALRITEEELIRHAGLDSAIYLKIYILGLKIFVPVTVLALLVIIPINISGGTLLSLNKQVVFSNIDRLSISNVSPGSRRFFVHILMAYVFTLWTLFMLYKEYANVARMRLQFLASQTRRVDQFTVIVQNIPYLSGRSFTETADEFFKSNHHDHYLGQQPVYNANKFAKLVKKRHWLQNWLDYYQLKHERHPNKKATVKTGFCCCGRRVNAVDYYQGRVDKLNEKISSERIKVLEDKKSIMPVSFVTFDSRWGAAVCAQTQQSRNPTRYLTDWAPEPRDIFWPNLAIPFFSLSLRRLVITLLVFALVFFYLIPIAFVQSLANLEQLEKVAPFLKPVIEKKLIKSFLQGFLPGLTLKIFLSVLPAVLLMLSKIEGYITLSSLERKAAAKYYYFMLVNVFLGSIITGTAFQQLHAFIHQPPGEFPRTIGVSIPMKATFFMTYIMVDGWAGVAGEIVRLSPLVIFHLKNMFLVKTERDRDRAMDPGSIGLPRNLPHLQLYFLLGLVYAVITPILLPFILIFFVFAFLVYRHQIINVYNQEYESAGAFWPSVQSRMILSLLISQILLAGLLSTKRAANSTPILIVLPVITIWFHFYCKKRFEPAFRKYPIEEATQKDTLEKGSDPNFNLKNYLADAYLHPMFQQIVDEETGEVNVNVVNKSPDEAESRTSPDHVAVTVLEKESSGTDGDDLSSYEREEKINDGPSNDEIEPEPSEQINDGDDLSWDESNSKKAG